MERDAPSGRRDDLRDSAAHLAGADDEDVLEAHGGVSLTSSGAPGRLGRVPRAPSAGAPSEDEREDQRRRSRP